MSDFPHGHSGHSGWGCKHPDCVARIAEKEKTVNDMMKDATVIEGENSLTIHNMGEGKWVQQRDGSLVSIEYAKTLNRAQRRKRGIKL